MDKAYSRSKKALDKSGKLMATVDTLKKEVKALTRQLENTQIEIIRVEEDGDKAKVKTLKESLKAPKKELEEKKQQLEKLEATVQKNQATIDEKMAELSQDPALKAHLNEVIGKKFSRQLVKFQKGKDEKIKQNETLLKIQEAAKQNPNVMYWLKSIEDSIKQIDFTKKVIADPTQPSANIANAQNVLPNLENFLEKTRSDLARYFKGSISREVIDKITSYENLVREIKANERQIKGFDKQIANYETALQNIGFESPLRDSQPSDRSDDSSSTTRTNAERTAPSTSTPPTPTPNLPATQPKWWQFIKKFKNWNAARKERNAEETEPAPVSQEDRQKFKNSMKYEVVRDYEEKMAADLLKQAKAQNRPQVDRENAEDEQR